MARVAVAAGTKVLRLTEALASADPLKTILGGSTSPSKAAAVQKVFQEPLSSDLVGADAAGTLANIKSRCYF